MRLLHLQKIIKSNIVKVYKEKKIVQSIKNEIKTLSLSSKMKLKLFFNRVSSDIPIVSHYRSHNNENAFKRSVLNELLCCVLQCVLLNVFLLFNP